MQGTNVSARGDSLPNDNEELITFYVLCSSHIKDEMRQE